MQDKNGPPFEANNNNPPFLQHQRFFPVAGQSLGVIYTLIQSNAGYLRLGPVASSSDA